MARSKPGDSNLDSFEEVEEEQENYRIETVYFLVSDDVDVSRLLTDLEGVEGVVFGGRTRGSAEDYRKGLKG